MFQGFPGDYDSGSRCGPESPPAESQYLSPLDSFGSPAPAGPAQVRRGRASRGAGDPQGGAELRGGRRGGGAVRKRAQ